MHLRLTIWFKRGVHNAEYLLLITILIINVVVPMLLLDDITQYLLYIFL